MDYEYVDFGVGSILEELNKLELQISGHPINDEVKLKTKIVDSIAQIEKMTFNIKLTHQEDIDKKLIKLQDLETRLISLIQISEDMEDKITNLENKNLDLINLICNDDQENILIDSDFKITDIYEIRKLLENKINSIEQANNRLSSLRVADLLRNSEIFKFIKNQIVDIYYSITSKNF